MFSYGAFDLPYFIPWAKAHGYKHKTPTGFRYAISTIDSLQVCLANHSMKPEERWPGRQRIETQLFI